MFRQAPRILRRASYWYSDHHGTLAPEQLAELDQILQKLEEAIDSQNDSYANELTQTLINNFPQTLTYSWRRIARKCLIGLCLLLASLFFMRAMWFEIYQIPTGSMRPTLREGDHILVSKTAFAVNNPFKTGHLYFDPALIQRTSIMVWTSDGNLLPDKRYIKRLIGKPGDILYFYGGKIYGIDRNGRDISGEFDTPWMKGLEFFPFSTFEGHITTASTDGSNLVHEIFLNQMGKALGRLTLKGYGVLDGDIHVNDAWYEDNPVAQRIEHVGLETYTDFWGMRNYAMARLLTKEQVRQLTDTDMATLEDASLYLELRHSPNLTNPKPRFQEGPDGRIRLMLTPHVSVIPLQERHLMRLMEGMYTSRFIVQDGRAAPYSPERNTLTPSSPMFTKVPDGIYEFHQGKAYSIDWKNTPHEVDSSHALYRKIPSHIQRLFNLGMDVDADFAPTKVNQVDFPARYAYFRDGELYVMGMSLIRKNEPTMQHYMAHEFERQRRATRKQPYIAFIDYGPPIHNNRLNTRFVRTFGLEVPEGQFLMLGDNHANSIDSRYFGFIPQENLLGVASHLLWPIGDRWGELQQPALAWATIPRAIVWAIVWSLIALVYYLMTRRASRRTFTRAPKKSEAIASRITKMMTSLPG